LLNSIILDPWFLFIGGLVYFDTLGVDLATIAGILEDDLSPITVNIGMISILFSNVAISKTELFKSSPTCRDGIDSLEGFDRIKIISVAAWCRKSANRTDGYSIVCGKNSTVSKFTTDFILKI